jgi:hypothetical protein
MPEYVKVFFSPPLSKPASALLEIHLQLFTLNKLRVFEQTLAIVQQVLTSILSKIARNRSLGAELCEIDGFRYLLSFEGMIKHFRHFGDINKL